MIVAESFEQAAAIDKDTELALALDDVKYSRRREFRCDSRRSRESEQE